MTAKFLRIPHKVDRKVSRLPLNIQNRIDDVFNKLKENPIAGVKLKGELGNYYKYRLGDYRIIYRFDRKKSLLEIVKIEHRQGVYR